MDPMYLLAGGGLLVSVGVPVAIIVGRIIIPGLKESGLEKRAIEQVERREEEIKEHFGEEIGDVVLEAEKIHARVNALDYVRYNSQVLSQANANYMLLVAIAQQLEIPETDPRVNSAKQLHNSANSPDYVRRPQLLEQANANYELSLSILERLQK